MLESLVPMFISRETFRLSPPLLASLGFSLFLPSSLAAHFPLSPPLALFPLPPRDSEMRKASSLPGIKYDCDMSSGHVPTEQVRGRRSDIEKKEMQIFRIRKSLCVVARACSLS